MSNAGSTSKNTTTPACPWSAIARVLSALRLRFQPPFQRRYGNNPTIADTQRREVFTVDEFVSRVATNAESSRNLSYVIALLHQFKNLLHKYDWAGFASIGMVQYRWGTCRAPNSTANGGSYVMQKRTRKQFTRPKNSITAERLTRERLRLGLTQEELSEKTGYSTGAIRKYEQGERLPSSEFVGNMAAFFKCAPEYLTGKWGFRTADEEARAETQAMDAVALYKKCKKAHETAISGALYLMDLLGFGIDTQQQTDSHLLNIIIKSKDGEQFKIYEPDFVKLLETFAENTKDVMLELLQQQRKI